MTVVSEADFERAIECESLEWQGPRAPWREAMIARAWMQWMKKFRVRMKAGERRRWRKEQEARLRIWDEDDHVCPRCGYHL